MAAGSRTTAVQSGEMPARLPSQPKTSVAVKTAIAVRGSMIQFQMNASVSSQLSRAMRGVFARIRVASHAGGSKMGNVFAQTSTSRISTSNSLHAEHER